MVFLLFGGGVVAGGPDFSGVPLALLPPLATAVVVLRGFAVDQIDLGRWSS